MVAFLFAYTGRQKEHAAIQSMEKDLILFQVALYCKILRLLQEGGDLKLSM